MFFYLTFCIQVFVRLSQWSRVSGSFNGTMDSTPVKFPKHRLKVKSFHFSSLQEHFFASNGSNHLLLSEEHLQLIRFAGQFLEKPPKTISTISVKPAPFFTNQ